MCLGVPGRLIERFEGATGPAMGRVDFGGITKDVCLAYVPEAAVGDYVVVHVGFAIVMVDEVEAELTLGYLRALDGLAELSLAAPD
jgi:hydrogenase expression/formation protein HypC